MTTREALSLARAALRDLPAGQAHLPRDAAAALVSAGLDWRLRPASDGGELLGFFQYRRDAGARWRTL